MIKTTGNSRQKKTPGAALLILLAAAFLLLYQEKQEPGVELEQFQEAEFVRVVDGDTMIVLLDGERQRVRLIGINCEEIHSEDESRNTEKGRQESAFVENLMESGDTVYLQKDVSETDQYDRLLRYVWLELPEDPTDPEEVRQKMLSAILVDQMDTRVKDYPPDLLYSEILWEIHNDR